MKLTDNEKREILKLIEVDKPLPGKYRFMLSFRYEKRKDITSISGTAGVSPRYSSLPHLGTAQRSCGVTLRFNGFEFVSDFVLRISSLPTRSG